MIYRVNYNWFTIHDRGEFYFDYTVGHTYAIPGTAYKDVVENIEVKGSVLNRVAVVHFKLGATIEQTNINAVIILTDNYGSASEPEKTAN